MLSGDERSDAPHLHTRVSVGQLRSALLQQTGNGVQPEGLKPEVYVSVSLCVSVCARLTHIDFVYPGSFKLFDLTSTLSTQLACRRCHDDGRATSSLDLAVRPGGDGGRRRARRYQQGALGGGRKSGERFRTQPITAEEVEESSG